MKVILTFVSNEKLGIYDVTKCSKRFANVLIYIGWRSLVYSDVVCMEVEEDEGTEKAT